MEQIAEEEFSPNDLKAINRCRIHLQVTTLADIVLGCGRKINKQVMKVIKDEEIPQKYMWPTQPRPHQTTRAKWRKAIKKAFPHATDGTVEYTLGNWLENDNTWYWYYDPHNTGYLYRKRNQIAWKMYKRISRAGPAGRNPKFEYYTEAFQLPLTSRRATVQKMAIGIYQVTGYNEFPIMQLPAAKTNHRPGFHSQAHCNLQMYLKGNSLERRQRISQAIVQGQVRVVSDGSYLNKKDAGTAGFVIEDNEKIDKVQGSVDGVR